MNAILAQARTRLAKERARRSQRPGPLAPPGRRDVEANANAGREQFHRRDRRAGHDQGVGPLASRSLGICTQNMHFTVRSDFL